MARTIAPQDITPASTSEQVEAKISSFIYQDTDGAQRLDTEALTTYLSDQFSYFTAAGASAEAKYAQANTIALNLAAVVNKGAWTNTSGYPAQSASDGAAITDLLVNLQDEMRLRAEDITTQYRAFDLGLPARVKSIFNSVVTPSIADGVTRGYIETFVTDLGEESAPSPISALVTIKATDPARITTSAAPAGRFISKRRLYRSATGSAQSAFKLQGEYDIAQTVIDDSKLDAELNDVCATFGWIEPPADLQGLTGMANGIMIGFVGRTLYACEPYSPYAFPAKYDKPLPHAIVGIVSLGQSAFIGTDAYPYLVSGTDSASLSEERIPDLAPCASARSMVAIAGSVFYAGQDGLALYENGRVTIVSDGIDRKTWQAYNPASMRAAGYDSRYIAFFTRADNSRGALVFDYKSKTLCELDQGADAVLAAKDGIFILDGAGLYNLLPADQVPRHGLFASKTFRLPKPDSFGWIQVDSEFNAGPVTLRLYADDVLHQTLTITSDRPVRCRPGLITDLRLEVESDSTISGILLASTTQELKAAQ